MHHANLHIARAEHAARTGADDRYVLLRSQMRDARPVRRSPRRRRGTTWHSGDAA